MRILIIDDDPQEIERAKEIIRARGHELVTPINPDKEWFADSRGQDNFFPCISHGDDVRQEADGVITDLNFKMPGTSGRSGITPSGLLVAFHAALFGKPAVICTKVNEKDRHHGKATSWIYDGYFSALSNSWKPDMFSRCPGWIEEKDWEAACELLEKKFAALQQKNSQEQSK